MGRFVSRDFISWVAKGILVKECFPCSFSVCLCLVYRKVTDFHVLILYPATLLNVFISCRSFLAGGGVSFCMSRIPPSASGDTPFPICIPSISFLCLLVPAKTSSIDFRVEVRRSGHTSVSGML